MGKIQCKACTRVFSRHEVETVRYTPKNPRTSTRARADKHEKHAAKVLGAQKTIASGQTPIDKGDVKSDFLRAECKTTEKKSFVLKLDALMKIARQASGDQMPVFNIQFNEGANPRNYYIIPEGWFLQLLEAYKIAQDTDD